MKLVRLLLVVNLIFAAACKNSETSDTAMELQPPLAEKKEKLLEIHGDVRIDNYYWLNERENEEVIDYLERENDYYAKMTAHTDDLKESLFQEMVAFHLVRMQYPHHLL